VPKAVVTFAGIAKGGVETAVSVEAGQAEVGRAG
jgi:hypothetical protein